jgi:GNAT superfamily N-acetyltransferase
MPATPADCLACLPDDDRCVDLRGMLLSGRCRLHGDSAEGFVACSGAYPYAVAWGVPSPEVVRAAADTAGWEDAEEWHLLADGETVAAVAAALPGWKRRGVVLHRWPHESSWPLATGGAKVRVARHGWRRAGFAVDHLPDPLRRELAHDWVASRPLAAVFVDGRMVSWCSAAVETETLWDVAVDTLAPHRRRRLATACFAALANEMERRGKRPVWGALEENAPSMRLAARLGFETAARLTSFVRP